jgi:hypothetical protein
MRVLKTMAPEELAMVFSVDSQRSLQAIYICNANSIQNTKTPKKESACQAIQSLAIYSLSLYF